MINSPRYHLHRHGSAFALTLMSTLVVSVICLASLQLIGVKARESKVYDEFAEAQFQARSAIEIGMLKIRNDPYWRTNLGNGAWLTNQAIGNGSVSLSASDPIDNDVTKGDNHPLVLTAVATKGSAVFKTSVRLEVGPRIGSCLEVSMVSGDDTTIKTATLTSDQVISANRKMDANTANVNADVEAVQGTTGATYNQLIKAMLSPRALPNSADVFEYYLANGTTIPYSSLTKWTRAEMLSNTTFELNTVGWSAVGTCVLEQSLAQSKGGNYSLLVKSRSNTAANAVQNLPLTGFINGNTYELSMPIFPTSATTAQAALTIESTGDGIQTFLTPVVTLAKDANGNWNWTDVSGPIVPTWTGTLTKATVSLKTGNKNNYYMDAVSLTDITYPKDDYVMFNQLLSPTVNPYGFANAAGIYIIDCGNKDVIVANSRIVGTVVFLNPGGNSTIQGSVSWEAPVYNYPALLTNAKILINLSSTGLTESKVSRNLNPTGTAFPFESGGATNATQADSYPSKITGIVYGSKDLLFSGTTWIKGLVIVGGKIEVTATSLTLNYVNTYLNDPPPGFDIGTVTMRIIPGSWKRVVD